MSLRLFLVLIIIMAIGFSHVSILNSGAVKFYLTPSKFVEMALSELTLITFALGAAIVLVGTFFKDAASSARQWKTKRIQTKKENAYDKLKKARDLFYQNKASSALEVVESVLPVIPENREALHLKAKIQREMGDRDGLLETLANWKEHFPADVELRLLLSKEHDKDGKIPKAIEELTSLKKQDEYLPVVERLIELHIANDDFSQAYELQKSLTKKKGKRAQVGKDRLNSLRYRLAKSAFDTGNFDNGEKILKELAKEEHPFTPAYIYLHEISLQKGDIPGAMQWLITGYRRTGNAIQLIKLEDIAIEHESPGELLEIYSHLKDEFSEDFTLIIFYGKFLLRLEMVDEAMEQFLKAENLDADNAAVHIFLAEAYRRRERFQEAIDEYSKAFAYKRRYLVPFVCSGCGEKVIRWKDYCEKCREWDTFHINYGDTRELKRIREEALQKVPVPD